MKFKIEEVNTNKYKEIFGDEIPNHIEFDSIKHLVSWVKKTECYAVIKFNLSSNEPVITIIDNEME